MEKERSLLAYLLWAFGIAWVLQITAGVLYRKGNAAAYTIILAVSMFAPMLAVPTLVLNPAYGNQLLLGPLMIGLVGGLPMILLAAWLCPRGSAAPAHEGGLG